MKKKLLFAVVSIFLLCVCVYNNFPVLMITNVYARSEPVVDETEEREDAVLGPVTICAVFDTIHDKRPVVVELFPTFEGGVIHSYTLTSTKSMISDKIAIGNYYTRAFLADENFDYKNSGLRIYCQNTPIVVVESPEGEAPSSVTLIADYWYVERYGVSIVNYRDKDGKALRGVMSETDAYYIQYERNAAQDISKGDSLENSDTEDIEKPVQEEFLEGDEIREKEKIEKKEKKGITTFAKFIILAIIIFAAFAVPVSHKEKHK